MWVVGDPARDVCQRGALDAFEASLDDCGTLAVALVVKGIAVAIQMPKQFVAPARANRADRSHAKAWFILPESATRALD